MTPKEFENKHCCCDAMRGVQCSIHADLRELLSSTEAVDKGLEADRAMTRALMLSECIAALDERVDSLVTMCDRAGYTREGADLSQRVVATRDAIEIIRRLQRTPYVSQQPPKEK